MVLVPQTLIVTHFLFLVKTLGLNSQIAIDNNDNNNNNNNNIDTATIKKPKNLFL